MRISLLSLACLPLLACGGGGSGGTDAGSAHGSGSGGGHGSGSGGGSGSSGACAVPDSFSPTFGGSDQQAVNEGVGSDHEDEVVWFGNLTNVGTVVGGELRIFTFSGGGSDGSAGTPDWPGAFGAKSGVDFSTAIDAFAAVVGDFGGSDDTAQTIYISQAGTLNLTQAGSAAGAKFAGTLVDGDFIHVDFAANGDLEVAADGCESALPSASFNATVKNAGSGGGSGSGSGSAFAPSFHVQQVPVGELRNFLRHRSH